MQTALKETARPPVRTERTGFALPRGFPTHAAQAGTARGAGPSPAHTRPSADKAHLARLQSPTPRWTEREPLFLHRRYSFIPLGNAELRTFSVGRAAAGGGAVHLQGFCGAGARPVPQNTAWKRNRTCRLDLGRQRYTAQSKDGRSPRSLCSPSSCTGSFALLSRPTASDATAPASSAAPARAAPRSTAPGPSRQPCSSQAAAGSRSHPARCLAGQAPSPWPSVASTVRPTSSLSGLLDDEPHCRPMLSQGTRCGARALGAVRNVVRTPQAATPGARWALGDRPVWATAASQNATASARSQHCGSPPLGHQAVGLSG